MRHIAILIILLSFLTPCSGQTSTNTTKFKKEIPTWKNGEEDLFYKLTQQKVKQLKIDSLQSGYDSLQIRIWYDYSLMTLRKLLVIKRTNNTWTATSYTMTVDWNASDLTEIVKAKKIEILNPKNGWSSFLNKLFFLQITTLPNMDNIPGLQDGWTDGISYNVEVATKKQYRFYGYHLPDKFQDKYWQAKNMVKILKLVEIELGITSGIR
ncbi:hypothetical protein NF867_14475 [Solitalea sp. MAHUQ-68]|uniref:DUF4136 domain-containing protein n=1 Tax=Solitalea agri TaxID=2953739 RepID=A0A9X2JDV7_9SPHI|nr:hypothetical protein [Solitalea agri]MCO4294069.1 hypothetical protein [Solitalea agri]